MIDGKLYQRYLQEFIREALKNSDGTKAGVATYLMDMSGPGRFTPHRNEKAKALNDARQAFNEHRHWPMEIILSHLGFDLKELKNK
jgi:hypothetical protein